MSALKIPVSTIPEAAAPFHLVADAAWWQGAREILREPGVLEREEYLPSNENVPRIRV